MRKRFTILLACFIAAALVCMLLANMIQHGFGKIDVQLGRIETDEGILAYKLYKPKSASASAPAPAVLLLHGYQNDKETNAAFSIELARRGVVVMSLDEYGHGGTSIGMISRGYVNHKVKTNYGKDLESPDLYVSIGGAERYRLMMNFSNQSFFIDRYSKDDDGNRIYDSSMGGIAAYAVLSGFDFVDPSRMGVSGHSMGTWSSWSVAAAYSGVSNMAGTDISPKAVILQCGELFSKNAYDADKIRFNNVLLLTAQYDEFNYFRDYEDTVTDDMPSSAIRSEFLGCSPEEASWDTTFGSFSDGSARRTERIFTNHRLTTHSKHALETSMQWFADSLAFDSGLEPEDQVFMAKEALVLAAMLLMNAAMLVLFELLLSTQFFSSLDHRLEASETLEKSGWKWWKGAIITVLIAFGTYPFMTQLGHGLLPLPERSLFRMTIGNGFLSWYLLLIAIMLLTTILSQIRRKKKGLAVDYHALGFANEDNPSRFDWALAGKGALLAICMAGLMYAFTIISEKLFLLDLRFIWPFFKGFSWVRFGQLGTYLPVFAVFFVLNNSKIFAQMRCSGASKRGLRGFAGCWWRNALCMVGGILLLVLLEYIPFFAGAGPGADLLFGTTFGGPFMSLMILFVPQVLVFSVICTYAYRRTSTIYTGAFVVAILACWIVTGGSAIL